MAMIFSRLPFLISGRGKVVAEKGLEMKRNGDLDDELITSQADKIILSIEITKLVHETVGIGSTNDKAHESTGITKNSVLDLDGS